MEAVDQLHHAGQVVWLDDLSRDLLDSGTLEALDAEGVGGVTADPTIYDRAIAEGSAYADAIRGSERDPAAEPEAVFWDLAVTDIANAADLLRPRFDRSKGTDGLVSLELSPDLAHDAEATVEAGHELFDRIGRPNVLIKVPGTPAGVTAVEGLTAAGVNVNVTLVFGLDQYQSVWSAYVDGLHRRMSDGAGVGSIHSVASFSLAPIDDEANDQLPGELRNELGVALARMAYDQWLMNHTIDRRWTEARRAGANQQRLLWASTSPKDENLSATHYPERLIAPDTIVTVPPETLGAMRELAVVDQPRLHQRDVGYASEVILAARNEGLDPDALATDLQDRGVAAFADSWRSLLGSIASLASH